MCDRVTVAGGTCGCHFLGLAIGQMWLAIKEINSQMAGWGSNSTASHMAGPSQIWLINGWLGLQLTQLLGCAFGPVKWAVKWLAGPQFLLAGPLAQPNVAAKI